MGSLKKSLLEWSFASGSVNMVSDCSFDPEYILIVNLGAIQGILEQ